MLVKEFRYWNKFKTLEEIEFERYV